MNRASRMSAGGNHITARKGKNSAAARRTKKAEEDKGRME